jgi:arginyl-tRNA synthetase
MRIKNHLANLVEQAIRNAQQGGALPTFTIPDVTIERPQKKELGDFASSTPLKLAREARRAPLQIAQAIVGNFPADPVVAKAEAAAPGFINITLSDAWVAKQVETILAEGEAFGNLQAEPRQRINVEYVSTNPTGPMHVGSGRNGAIGDTLANVLKAAGHDVWREFYVNDAGSQIVHFGASLYATYAQALGRDEKIPEDGYHGAYVVDMGKEMAQQHGDRFLQLPREQAIREIGSLGIEVVRERLAETLARIDIRFDEWFSERSLYEGGTFAQVFKVLQDKGLIFEKDGATWFAAQELGEEKDAVLIRSPQIIADPELRPTYLASDVAYAWSKLGARAFDRAIYVLGADHHGDAMRIRAVARALGIAEERINILIYQFVNLKRGDEMVKMSKRTGEFVTLNELIDEVGADAVRFMLIAQSANTTMEFDLELAVKQSNENPVYYVQYAHARIASILKHAAELGATWEGGDVSLLNHPTELELIREMLRLPEIVEIAASRLEPHHLPHYAIEIAGVFHAFYKECRVVSSDPADAAITRARLRLVLAAKNTLARTLRLMGVRAPESM